MNSNRPQPATDKPAAGSKSPKLHGFLTTATAVADFDGDGIYNVWEIDADKNLRETVKDLRGVRLALSAVAAAFSLAREDFRTRRIFVI